MGQLEKNQTCYIILTVGYYVLYLFACSFMDPLCILVSKACALGIKPFSVQRVELG